MSGWWNKIKGTFTAQSATSEWTQRLIDLALGSDDEGWSQLTGVSAGDYSAGLLGPPSSVSLVKRENAGMQKDRDAWILYPFLMVRLETTLGTHASLFHAVEWSGSSAPLERLDAVVYSAGMDASEYRVIRLIHAIANRGLVANIVGTHVRTKTVGPSVTEPFGLVVRRAAPVATPALLDLRGPGLFIQHALEHLRRLHAERGGYWIAAQTFPPSNFLWYDDRVEMASYEYAVLYKGDVVHMRQTNRSNRSIYFPDEDDRRNGGVRQRIIGEDLARFVASLGTLGVEIGVSKITSMYNNISI